MILKRISLMLYLLAFALTAHAADVPADAGLAEVRGLGSLNGEALACSHLAAASRIKSLIIKHAPKSRRYGEAFEAATSAAYLGQIKKGQDTCPDAAGISSQADELARRLQAAVPPELAQ